jgi:hypothetical protein
VRHAGVSGGRFGGTGGTKATSEPALVPELLGAFSPGMLVLADRNFLGFDMVERCATTGADLLWRASPIIVCRSWKNSPTVPTCRICPSPALEARSSGSIPFGSLLLVTLP